MAHKGKFNKKKCATCVYRGTHGAAGLGVDVDCNYFDTGKTATKHYRIIDILALQSEAYAPAQLKY